jgi:hypothetical protein
MKYSLLFFLFDFLCVLSQTPTYINFEPPDDFMNILKSNPIIKSNIIESDTTIRSDRTTTSFNSRDDTSNEQKPLHFSTSSTIPQNNEYGGNFCAPYSTSNSGYSICPIYACGGAVLIISTCPEYGGIQSSGNSNTYGLYTSSYSAITSNYQYYDTCQDGSLGTKFYYQVPTSTPCQFYYFVQACVGSTSCSAQFYYGYGSKCAYFPDPADYPNIDYVPCFMNACQGSRIFASSCPGFNTYVYGNPTVTLYDSTNTIPLVTNDNYNTATCGYGPQLYYTVTEPGCQTYTLRQSCVGGNFNTCAGILYFDVGTSLQPKAYYSYVMFSSSLNTNGGVVNTPKVGIRMCSGDQVFISTCPAYGGFSTGQLSFVLFNYIGVSVSNSNNFDCGGGVFGAQIIYTASEDCQAYTLNQGCSGNTNCNGKMYYGLGSLATAYSVSNTNNALQNTANFNLQFCAGDTLVLSTCNIQGSASGSYVGDPFYRLYDDVGNQVASNDDACGLGAEITYNHPSSAVGCAIYTLKQGCYGSGSCSGQMYVTGAKVTLSTTLFPTTSPTQAPTQPTPQPTASPSFTPSADPSFAPVCAPSEIPSEIPSFAPSFVPSFEPSATPSTALPTVSPTANPTAVPTISPTSLCEAGYSQSDSNGIQVCSPCNEGTWAASGDDICTNCVINTYSTTVFATSNVTCLICPSFSTSIAGSSTCICNAGYSDGGTEGDTLTCSGCAAGTWAVSGDDICTNCDPNTYSEIVFATSIATCLTCPSFSTSIAGSSTCICNAGYSNEGTPSGNSLVCFGCTTGTWAASGDSLCTTCGINTYSTAIIATSNATCLTCPSYSTSIAGSSTCICNAGYSDLGSSGRELNCSGCAAGYWAATGDDICTMCDPNTYSEVIFATSNATCISCPPFSTSLTGSSTCKCSSGYIQTGSGSSLVCSGTSAPSSVPSSLPSSKPSSLPSRYPSSQPTSQPTASPSSKPSSQPSGSPSSFPSGQPTSQPSSQPSNQPTKQPSSQPSQQPTSQPSFQPSRQPTSQPSFQPSSRPTQQPTAQPSSQPSHQPSKQPTSSPTGQPTQQPTRQPTGQPSSQPSSQPTDHPSSQPTRQPTSQPSTQPTNQPTTQPTSQVIYMFNYNNIVLFNNFLLYFI